MAADKARLTDSAKALQCTNSACLNQFCSIIVGRTWHRFAALLMISLNNITLMRGTQTLIRDASALIAGGQRTGIIGRNGSGKTSLFKALAGEIQLEQGEIDMPNGLRRVSMAQETPAVDRCALDFVIDAHTAYRELERKIATAEDAGDDAGLVRLHAALADLGVYDIRNQAEQLLSGLGFSPEQFSKTVAEFSGGWRVRLNLAAALMCPSDLLMLDEPTNHLDLEATVWLEQWLRGYRGTILVISHDRTFLDAVIDHVISLESGTLALYRGNYSAYERQRAERMALQAALYAKQQRRRGEIEDFVRRFKAKASKARQAQSRLKELDRMQDIAPAHADSPFRFSFPAVESDSGYLLQATKLAIGFDAPLVENMSFAVRGDSRFGLLGFNGSGKSTLLKVLASAHPALAGEMVAAKKLRIGYFAQHQVDELDQHATPVEIIQALGKVDASLKASEQAIRDYLGGFDFRGTRVDERITHFSGGEKARLALAKVAWERPNLLLLDEPTNHLDLEMVHALTIALQEFEGAVVIVSHDRHLLANTVDEFFSIHKGNFAEFDGDLADYERWLSRYAEQEPSDLKASKGSSAEKRGTGEAGETSDNDTAADKKAQRQQAAALREQQAPLRKEVKKLELQMEKLQSRLKQIEGRLADEAMYAEANKLELAALVKEQGEARVQLDDVEETWLALQEQLEG